MVTVDTLLRLAGNLASAEKQYRECPVPQKARAWKIMEEAGDRIRDLIDGRRPAEASDAEQIPHPVAEAEQSPQPAGGLVWTKEKPTEVGYYWSVVPLKNALPPQIVFIDERPAGLVAYATDGRSGLLENTNKDTQWAGPIPEPLAQAPTRNAGEAQP